MIRIGSILPAVLVMLVGCVEFSPQEVVDAALRRLDRQQERLDRLRPAYDAARQTAAETVCREIAGVTPEESAAAALEQLQGVMSGAADAQAASAAADPRPVGDVDAAIDQLLAAHETIQETQVTLSAPITKANAVMAKIKTPGTPEANRFEEVLAAMPEVQAYERQFKRVERAQKEVDEAEAALPDAGGDKST